MKFFFVVLFLIPLHTYSQVMDIKGSVYSDSEVLSYASVSILDSNLGVIADENGKFDLKVDLSIYNTLFVSYLGHISQKISLKDPSFDYKNL